MAYKLSLLAKADKDYNGALTWYKERSAETAMDLFLKYPKR